MKLRTSLFENDPLLAAQNLKYASPQAEPNAPKSLAFGSRLSRHRSGSQSGQFGSGLRLQMLFDPNPLQNEPSPLSGNHRTQLFSPSCPTLLLTTLRSIPWKRCARLIHLRRPLRSPPSRGRSRAFLSQHRRTTLGPSRSHGVIGCLLAFAAWSTYWKRGM